MELKISHRRNEPKKIEGGAQSLRGSVATEWGEGVELFHFST